jgi:signal peptidase
MLTRLRPLHRYLPSVGRVTIIMNDQPIVKYLLIGVLAIFVLTSKE